MPPFLKHTSFGQAIMANLDSPRTVRLEVRVIGLAVYQHPAILGKWNCNHHQQEKYPKFIKVWDIPSCSKMVTLLGTNISHPWKRKIIFPGGHWDTLRLDFRCFISIQRLSAPHRPLWMAKTGPGGRNLCDGVEPCSWRKTLLPLSNLCVLSSTCWHDSFVLEVFGQ